MRRRFEIGAAVDEAGESRDSWLSLLLALGSIRVASVLRYQRPPARWFNGKPNGSSGANEVIESLGEES